MAGHENVSADPLTGLVNIMVKVPEPSHPIQVPPPLDDKVAAKFVVTGNDMEKNVIVPAAAVVSIMKRQCPVTPFPARDQTQPKTDGAAMLVKLVNVGVYAPDDASTPLTRTLPG